MPRQRMAPGEHGKITDTRNGDLFTATTYLRLHSGKLRERVATSRKSGEDARRELKRRIVAELAAGEPTGVINHRTTVDELFEAWITAKVAEDRIGERTVTLYRACAAVRSATGDASPPMTHPAPVRSTIGTGGHTTTPRTGFTARTGRSRSDRVRVRMGIAHPGTPKPNNERGNAPC